MTLLEAVESINGAEVEPSEDVVYARKPWVLESEALIMPAPDYNSVPEAAARSEMVYFLEVSITKEVLEGVAANLSSIEEKCLRVIRYAIMDA
jgi:hypothetical protein